MKTTFSLIALAALAAGNVRAESEPAPAPVKEFSEAVADKLGELRMLTEAKRFDEAGKLVDSLLRDAAPDSYDRIALSQIRAQIFIALNRYEDAVEPVRYVIRVGEARKFVDAAAARELTALLSRIHYRLAQEPANAARKADLLETSLSEYKDSLRRGAGITADDRLYIASLLLEIGTLDAEKPDKTKLESALAETRESLVLAVAPKPDARLLELSTLLQLGRTAESVDVLELLLKQDPANENHWRRLIATHLALAAETSDPAAARPHHLRALLAYERAQSRNLLNTPRDNRSVAGILLALERLDTATELLTKGLASGTIEDTAVNRELLASTYLRANKPEKAEAAYADAIARFPKEASPELALGQLLYSRDNLAGAYDHLAKGVGKDGAQNPGRNRFFLAFLAYELRRYEDAAKWAEAAKAFPDSNPAEIARLTQAARAALKEAANG